MASSRTSPTWSTPRRGTSSWRPPSPSSKKRGEVKLRRGEDWHRHHNATVQASDVPTHHVVGDYVDMAARLAQQGENGADLGPRPPQRLSSVAEVPSHSGAILHTASGPTLWFHYAMCFGAAASMQPLAIELQRNRAQAGEPAVLFPLLRRASQLEGAGGGRVRGR